MVPSTIAFHSPADESSGHDSSLMLSLEFIKRRRVLFALVGLIALNAAVYWRVGGHEFLRYDDPDYVTLNTHVNQGITAEGLAWAFGNLHGDATYWHPLTWVSHMIDCELFGLNPGPHHLVNLAFHIINVVLLFLVVLRMTDGEHTRPRVSRPAPSPVCSDPATPEQKIDNNFWPSLLLAALWSVHPLQVDTVAWVTERKNLLSGMFWLLTMAAYLRYAEKPNLARYWPVPVLMALGLMTKPILVTLPCALLLLDFWPLRRWQASVRNLNPNLNRNPISLTRLRLGLRLRLGGQEQHPHFPAQPLSRLLLEKLPLLALSIASSAITIIGHQKLGSILTGEEAPLSLRLQSAVVSYARYLGKALLPVDLSVFYPNPGTWPLWQVLVSAVILLGISAVVILQLRRIPAAAVGWFWFLGVMTPTVGILQAGSQSIADRFMYLPILGLLLAAIWSGKYLFARAYSLSSSEELRAKPRRENDHFLAGERRLVDASQPSLEPARKGPVLAMATFATLLVLASATASIIQVRHWKDTFTLFSHAMQVTEKNYIAYAVIGTLLQERGQANEALPYLQQALLYQPGHHECRLVFANALSALKQHDAAFEQYAQAIDANPRFADGYNSWAASLAAAGRFSEALPKVDQALRLQPTHINASLLRALVLQHLGRVDDAAAASREALRLRPTATSTLLALGNGFLRHRRFQDALPVFQHVLVVNPDSVEALNRVAWLLSTSPDPRTRNGPEALRLANRACELTANRDPLSLNALAAACAETGQFPRAAETASRALELARQSGQTATTPIIEALLRHYQSGTPYRDK